MRAPEPVRDHPNATFVLGTTPLTTLVGFAALKLHLVLPQYVAAALGTVVSGSLLIFRGALVGAAAAVWTLGVSGCCKRIWRGIEQNQ